MPTIRHDWVNLIIKKNESDSDDTQSIHTHQWDIACMMAYTFPVEPITSE